MARLKPVPLPTAAVTAFSRSLLRLTSTCYSLRAGSLRAFAIAALELGPRTRLHIAQQWSLPGIFGMLRQKVFSAKIFAARVSGPRDQSHLCSHIAVSSFALHGSTRVIRIPIPNLNSAWSGLTMTAESAFVGLLFLVIGIVVIRKELLRHGYVDLALVLPHQFFPSGVARVGRSTGVLGIEIGFVLDELWIASEI